MFEDEGMAPVHVYGKIFILCNIRKLAKHVCVFLNALTRSDTPSRSLDWREVDADEMAHQLFAGSARNVSELFNFEAQIEYL